MGLDVTAVGDAVGKILARGWKGVKKSWAGRPIPTTCRCPGMLYGAVLGSPYPHARILSIYTTEAAGLAGCTRGNYRRGYS